MAKPHVGGLLRFTGRMRRLGWGVADQGASSITNFALVFLVAHSLRADGFGAFSLAYTTYAFAINISRSVTSYPLQVRFSGAEIPRWRRAVASSSGTALIVGFAAGLVVLAASTVMTGSTKSSFTALGLMLPGLLLQDSWRYAFFVLGRGSQAFLNDVIWAAAQLPAMVLLRVFRVDDVFWFVLAWGGSAFVAALFGILQARVIPDVFRTMTWLVQHRDLASRYTLLDLLSGANAQLVTYVVGGVLGLAVVGYIRAASTLMGPFQIMFFGISLVTVPEAVRLLRTSPGNLAKFCLLVSAGLGVAALAWGGILLVGMPRGLGRLALGSIWKPTYPLIPFQVAAAVLQGFAAGAASGLNALGAIGRNLRANLIGAVSSVVLGVAGAYGAGVIGVMVAGVLASGIVSLALWRELRGALAAAGISVKVSRSLPLGRMQHSAIQAPVNPAARPD
jgi:O-antigen/teichoic acid export membrane protein